MGGCIQIKYIFKNHPYIFFIILVGFILRIYDLGNQSLWLDEAISSIAAIAFLEKGEPVLPSGIFYGVAILNTFLIKNSLTIIIDKL